MKSKTFQNKLGFLVLLAFLLFLLLLLRLADVQLRQGSYYRERAEDNRYFKIKEKAERAIFLDRYGDPLVENQKLYFQIEDPEKIFSSQTQIDQQTALNLLASNSAQVSSSFLRVYPYGSALAHVLGYLTPVTAEDLEANRGLALDEFLGRMGLEKYFDQILHSKAGFKKYEVNALGQKQKLVEFQEAEYGQNIQSSLDPYLALIAAKAMGESKGSVIIMDAETAEILVLYSSPSFDPNVFEQNAVTQLQSAGLKNKNNPFTKQIKEYLEDPRQLFYNRSISGTYPPGSIFKLVTALGALEEGVINQNTEFEDTGILKVGDYEYRNWYYTQYGRMDGLISIQRAISRSNDIFFYKTAEWLGPSKLAEYARLFSFGKKTSLEISGASEGLVPDPQWKEEVKGENWYLGNTYHFGIGQGDLLVTPLQVTEMTQSIANHGNLCSASLLAGKGRDCHSLNLHEENLELVLSGMIDACSSGGTAYPLFPHNQRMEALLLEEDGNMLTASKKIENGFVACKTGTAEFGAADERAYRKTHAWTIAIVGTPRKSITANEASPSAMLENRELIQKTKVTDLDAQEIHQLWLEKLDLGEKFPRKLVISVLVESDEERPYPEGSEVASPVIATLVDWIFSSQRQ